MKPTTTDTPNDNTPPWFDHISSINIEANGRTGGYDVIVTGINDNYDGSLGPERTWSAPPKQSLSDAANILLALIRL
jgi:hypothetical protein